MQGATRTCPQCAAPAGEEHRFCSRCGAPLEAARESRKVVTALFADVVGSTTLGERFDPEDFRDIVSEAVARAVRVCERYGGVIENVAGDGALALFGAPVAHEDDPERAVLAGLEIVEEVAHWAVEARERWGVESLEVRVGIETGPVVVGVHGTSIESGSMGDTLNTAARIQSEAAPGTVLVGARTQRAVEELFEWGPERELDLRGKQQPVVAREVLGRRPEPGPGRARSGQARIVGRDRELERVRRAVEKTVAGSGQVVLISGEAGVGKTRLLAELRELFDAASTRSGRPGLWLEGRCASYGEALPYWPIQGLLRDWLAGPVGEPLDLRTLEQRLSPLLAEAEGATIPHLAALLGVDAGSEPAAGDVESPGLGRQRIHDSVARLLERLSGREPVALVVEDVHWADASSADLLEHLAGAAPAGPLLVVATGRPEDGALDGLASVAQAGGGDRLVEIRLGALPAEAERALLEDLIGTGDIPAELEQRIRERAEGNPLYLEELALSLIETGVVVREADGWRFDHEAPMEIPDSLEKIVLSRVDRLPERCHPVLGAAAVLGRQFDPSLLEKVTGQECGPVLTELERAGLIRAEGPGETYRFKHFVIRESSYNALLRSERKSLHRRAAEALEPAEGVREQSGLGLVAGHYRAAGELERALDFRTRAAEAAAGIPAFPEALAHADDGLAIAEELGLDAADPRARRLLHRRGEARFAMGMIDEARRDLEEYVVAAREAGNLQEQMTSLAGLSGIARFRGDWDAAERHLVQALEIAEGLDDISTQTSMLRQLSILASNRLRLDRALEFGHRARQLAESAGSEADTATALDALKLAALFVGDLEMLDNTARPLIEYHRERDDLSMPRYFALVEWAHVPLLQGRFDEASSRLDEAWEDARRAGSRLFEPILLATRCWLERSRGAYTEAASHGRDAVETAAGFGVDEWESWARANLGWAFLDAGRSRPARAELEAGLRAAERADALAQEIRCAALLAEALVSLDEEARAIELADLAEELLSGVSTPAEGAWLWGGHATVALGRVRLAAGDAQRAGALVSPLAETAARAGWQELAADARVVLARVALAGGLDAEAREHLERALAEAGPYPSVAARAREALAALTGPPR